MTTAWAVLFITIALTQVAVVATSIYLHRALAHRSIHVHSLVDVGVRTALWFDVLSSLQTIPTAAACEQCVATYLGVSTAVSWPSRTAWSAWRT